MIMNKIYKKLNLPWVKNQSKAGGLSLKSSYLPLSKTKLSTILLSLFGTSVEDIPRNNCLSSGLLRVS